MGYGRRKIKEVFYEKKRKECNRNCSRSVDCLVVAFHDKTMGMAAENEKENATSKMKDAIDKVNKKIEPTKTRCEFSYHEETKRISIKVIDQKTEETIREIPPEETLDMLSKIWELAGLMVDERR